MHAVVAGVSGRFSGQRPQDTMLSDLAELGGNSSGESGGLRTFARGRQLGDPLQHWTMVPFQGVLGVFGLRTWGTFSGRLAITRRPAVFCQICLRSATSGDTSN